MWGCSDPAFGARTTHEITAVESFWICENLQNEATLLTVSNIYGLHLMQMSCHKQPFLGPAKRCLGVSRCLSHDGQDRGGHQVWHRHSPAPCWRPEGPLGPLGIDWGLGGMTGMSYVYFLEILLYLMKRYHKVPEMEKKHPSHPCCRLPPDLDDWSHWDDATNVSPGWKLRSSPGLTIVGLLKSTMEHGRWWYNLFIHTYTCKKPGIGGFSEPTNTTDGWWCTYSR